MYIIEHQIWTGIKDDVLQYSDEYVVVACWNYVALSDRIVTQHN